MNRPTSKFKFLAVLISFYASLLSASAETDFNQAIEAFKSGDYSNATLLFEAARKQGMNSVSLHFNLASSYYKLGDYESAIKYYQRVAEVPEMQEIAQYNLGLIAMKQKKFSTARSIFESILKQGKDRKLRSLARLKLADISARDERLITFVSSNLGYDDNITATPNETVLGISDSFYDVYLSLDWLFAGRRKQGWALDISYFRIDFEDSDSNDEYQVQAGMRREQTLSDWSTVIQINTSRNNFGGEDYQSSLKLDVKGRKALSKKSRIYVRYRYEDISSEAFNYDYLDGWSQRARIEYRQYATKNLKQLSYELEKNNRGDLITSTYAYDYSPTRHTVRAKYVHYLSDQWHIGSEISYRNTDYPASTSFNRDDAQRKLSLSALYRVNRTFKVNTKLQFTDNDSTVDRYKYDKATLRIGVSKFF